MTDTNTTEMIYKTTVAPAVSPAKLAFYEVRTGDVERLIDYYENSLGLVTAERSGSSAYLTTGGDHHCVVISPGEAEGRARLGFQVHVGLEETASRLQAAGVGCERRSDPEPGVSADLVIAEHGTGTPLHLIERQQSSGTPSAISGRPTKLGHVASYVSDLPSSQRFYLEIMGFRFSDMIGDFFTFLRCNADHHAINLMQSQKKSGLFHVAFEMRDMLHLKDQLDHLATRGHALLWGPGRHGVGHNIFSYHRDPDGNVVELFTEIDLIFDEDSECFEPRPWHEEFPQKPKVWPMDPAAANKWGIISPELMDH
ncbi:MAG: VOC family protein [Solirubrobacterales bacterium]|nr:VOC family protein [Solirubrobacterales bacterium]